MPTARDADRWTAEGLLLTRVMILRCAHCRTRFAADDAHRGKTFRCRVCASPIKSDDADAAQAAEANSSSHSRAALAATVSAPNAAYSTPASAPPPATATTRRHDERSKRDLFGGQVELASKVVERRESPFTAARNENSVLFSLDQLGKPPVRANDAVVFSSASSNAGDAGSAGASAVGGAKKEDSGLIDLNRMMNANDEKLSARSVRPAPISEAPLGYVREVSYTPASTTNEPNPFGRAKNTKKKTGLIAALAAAAVFAFAGVGVLANSHEDARVKAAAAAVAAPPPPPVAVAAPEPAPAPTTIAAKAPATTSDDKPETTKYSARKARKGATKSGGSSKSGSASAAPTAPAAPKKAPDPCGCKGNLLCTMKCSAR